jgi:hypothetical protein
MKETGISIAVRWKKRLLVSGVILGCALGIAGFERYLYARRSATLHRLTPGATKAEVFAALGKPDQGFADDEWHYDTVLPTIFYLWKFDDWDDMLVIFEENRVVNSYMCPE